MSNILQIIKYVTACVTQWEKFVSSPSSWQELVHQPFHDCTAPELYPGLSREPTATPVPFRPLRVQRSFIEKERGTDTQIERGTVIQIGKSEEIVCIGSFLETGCPWALHPALTAVQSWKEQPLS